jgi:hypothetical protein
MNWYISTLRIYGKNYYYTRESKNSVCGRSAVEDA